MKNTIIKFYTDAWFKVEYIINDTRVYFKAWKIEVSNEENPEQSQIRDETPEITGYIKWDGCMEFKHEEHYCSIEHAEQTLLLMNHIYKFNEEIQKNRDSL